MIRRVAMLCLLASISADGLAADVQINMYTNAPDGQKWVFEPSFVKITLGDTVTFVPKDKASHTSVSVLVPDGAKPWRAAPDTELKVKIEVPGVYLVRCDIHRSMGMVAVIQAGAAQNLAQARKRATEESSRMLINKDRYEKLLARVQ